MTTPFRLLAAAASVALVSHARAQQTVTVAIPFSQPALLASQVSGGGITGGLNNILMNSGVSGVVLQHNGGVLDVDHDYTISVPAGKFLRNGTGGQVILNGLPDPSLGYRNKLVVSLADGTAVTNRAELSGLGILADNAFQIVNAGSFALVEDCNVLASRRGISLLSGRTSAVVRNNSIVIGQPFGSAPVGPAFAVWSELGHNHLIEDNLMDGTAWYYAGIPATEPARPGCCRSGAPPCDLIAMYGCTDVLIIGNTVRNCNAAGIYIAPQDPSVSSSQHGVANHVIQNVISNTRQHGIDCAGQDWFLISENHIRKTDAAGIMTASSENGRVEFNDVAEADYLAPSTPVPGSCPPSVSTCSNPPAHSTAILVREGTKNCAFVGNIVSAAAAANGSQAAWGISFTVVPAAMGSAPVNNQVGGQPDSGLANTIYQGSSGWINPMDGNQIGFNYLL